MYSTKKKLAEIEGSSKEEAAETPDEEAKEMEGMKFAHVNKEPAPGHAISPYAVETVSRIKKYSRKK